MKMVECFTAGIIKGIKEHNDVSRYFGSTLSIKFHIQEAISLGVIEVHNIETKTLKLTTLGEKAYEIWQLKTMPECRSYLWPITKFDLNLVTNK